MGTGPLLASKPYSYKVHAIDLASQELRSQKAWVWVRILHSSLKYCFLLCKM